MLFILISLATTSASQTPATTSVRAEARITIVSPVTATKTDWDNAPTRRKREIVREENGQKAIIRVIDYE